jgi:protein AroM
MTGPAGKRLPQIGLVTIGQSPRADIVPEIAGMLTGSEIVEAGALDGLSREAIAARQPGPGDLTLVTRLADGSHVQVAKRHIIPLMQERISELEARVAAILIICTGAFPQLASRVPLLETQKLLHHAVKGMCSGPVGVIIPEAVQIPMAEDMWRTSGLEPVVVAGSPYKEPAQLAGAARQLAGRDIELVVLDCIGFTLAMKQAVKELVQKPVVLPRTLAARLLAELT